MCIILKEDRTKTQTFPHNNQFSIILCNFNQRSYSTGKVPVHVLTSFCNTKNNDFNRIKYNL